MASQQVPSVGSVVHFVATNGVHVPADICGVFEDAGTVSLFIKDSTTDRAYFERGVSFDPTGQTPGTWHWLEYMPPKGD